MLFNYNAILTKEKTFVYLEKLLRWIAHLLYTLNMVQKFEKDMIELFIN